jgi:hypothetical protein
MEEIRDRTFGGKCREECLISTFLQNSSQIISGADIIERKIKTIERLNRLNEWWLHENRERLKMSRQEGVAMSPLDLQGMTDTSSGYLQCCEKIDAYLDAILKEQTRYFRHDIPAFQQILKRLDQER